jgi:hypothetical protein
MEDSPHLVRVTKEDSPKIESAQGDFSAKDSPKREDSIGAPQKGTELRGGISVKMVALIVAVILVSAGGLYLWAEYLRHWSTEDVEEQVISDPTEATPGFRHNLAGRTVTVEGKVAEVQTFTTTLGELTYVYTEGSDYIALVVWGENTYEVGKKIEMKVHFEWAKCNDETHVYSPQIAFPWQQMLGMGVVMDSLSATSGSVLIPEQIDADTIRLEVFDQYPALSLSDANCTLRVGASSYVAEYVSLLGIWNYGHQMDFISNLSTGTSESDLIEFVDMDHDGWITAGDYLDVSGIERPDEDSGFLTYLVTIGRTNVTDSEYLTDILAGLSYLVVTKRGLMDIVYSSTSTNPTTPYARGSASVDGYQVTVTCDRLMEQVSWDDLEIQLTDGTNIVTWYPSEGGLDDGAPSMENLGSSLLNGTEISCVVTDLAGNGCIDEGDYFVLNAYDGFNVSDHYAALLIFTVTYERMFSAEF